MPKANTANMIDEVAKTAKVKVPKIKKKTKAVSRTKRSAATREEETRRKPWQPPSMLDMPTPPPGMHYRWIRAEIMGKDDKINMGKRFREGYVPVHPDEVEDQGYSLPVIDDGKHAGVIGLGGLILAKIPIETVKERRAYYDKQTDTQMNAVDGTLSKESDPIMPIRAPERKTEVTFGNPENRGTTSDE